MFKRDGFVLMGVMPLLLTLAFVPFALTMPVSEAQLQFLGAAAVFIIAFFDTNLALIILIFSMLLSPEYKAGATAERNITIRIDDIFLVITFLGWMAKLAIRKGTEALRVTPLNQPILVYILVCLVSTFLGILSGTLHYRSSLFFLLKYFEYFILYFMVVNNVHTIGQAKMFVFFLLVTCVIACIYGWSMLHTGQRLSTPFQEGGEPNTFAAYLLVMLGLILGLVVNAENPQRRLLFIGLFGVAAYPFLMTLSRGGWLGFFPMILTTIAFTKHFKTALIVALIAGCFILPIVAPQVVHKRFKETFNPEKTIIVAGKNVGIAESAADRYNAWGKAWSILKKKPILGVGIPAGYVIDNQYTRVMSETGLIGIAVYAWLLATYFRIGRHAHAVTEGNSFAQAVSLGYLSGFCGLLVMSLSCAAFILIRVMEPFIFLAGIVTLLPDLCKEAEAAA